jgi:peptide/nickel transport system substrate-binding protein
VSNPQRQSSSKTKQNPRDGAAIILAVVAGIFIVVAAIVVIFWAELQDLGANLVEDPQSELAGDVDEQTDDATVIDGEPETFIYVEATVGFPQTLNSLLATTVSERSVSSMMYRSLLYTDEHGDPAPDLATEWTVSDDGLVHTVELDASAEWHDGEPITAADVLFTVSLLQDPEFPGESDLSLFWKAITATQVDEQTIEFTLMEPYVGFGNYLKVPILPRHQFGSYLPGDLADIDLESTLVGSGPYRLDEVDIDAGEIHFVAHESGTGGPEQVVFRYYENRAEAISAFTDGDVDGVSYVPLENVHSSGDELNDEQLFDAPLAGYTALFFNVRHPYFRDVDTRRAIEHAIDREAIVDSILSGAADIGSSPVPLISSAHAPGSHLEFDPESAESLLERDGWVRQDGDEIRQRDGEYFLIPLIVNSDDPERIAVANLIQEQLREVGISVDVQVMSNQEVQQALQNRQFTAAMYGWRTPTGSLDGFQMWHSTRGEEGMNFTGFADSQADDHLVSARRSTSIEERNQHYAGFQQVFAEQVPAVVLFYPRYHFAVSDRIEGVEPSPLVDPGDRVRQIPEWRAGNT